LSSKDTAPSLHTTLDSFLPLQCTCCLSELSSPCAPPFSLEDH
jgi:hypothetical protein